MLIFFIIIAMQSCIIIWFLYRLPVTVVGFTEVIVRLYDEAGTAVVKQKCWAAYEVFSVDNVVEIKTAKLYYHLNARTMVERVTIALLEFPDFEAPLAGVHLLAEGDGSILFTPGPGASCILKLTN